MTVSFMPPVDPHESSQTRYSGQAGQPPSTIPTPVDPVHITSQQDDQDNSSIMNGHQNLFGPATSDPDQQTMTLQSSNGTLQQEEHHRELTSDAADGSTSDTQTWHVFSHDISVKTSSPGSESCSQENGHRGEVSFDSLDLEKVTLKLPVVKGQAGAQPATCDLTVVIPTRNECDNILPLLHKLQAALDGMHAEVIFVDDSDDDTPTIIKDASVAMETSMFHVHVEHRQPGTARAGGLATAVVHGMNRAQAAYVAIIDADLQHPPEQLRVLYNQATTHNADLVLASRYIKGGSYEGLAGVGRRWISVAMKWTAKLLFPEHLWRISDPLGGFFLLHRSLLAEVALRPLGYKILLEILIRCQWRHVLEVPYHFQVRSHGQSKATMQQGILAVRHMLRLWREVPAAGRLWKIALLLLLSLVIALALFFVHKSFPLLWAKLHSGAFAVLMCLDFVLWNRYIFPSTNVSSNVVLSRPSLMSIDNIAGVELHSAQNGNMNGYHPHSIDDLEKVELPSTQNDATNGKPLAGQVLTPYLML